MQIAALCGTMSGCTRAVWTGSSTAKENDATTGPVDIFSSTDKFFVDDQSQLHILRTFTVNVEGTSNIYGAGHAVAPAPGGGAPGILPVLVNLPPGTERYVQFSSVTGTICYWLDCSPGQGPDGNVGANTLSAYGGLAGFTSTRYSALTAVFLDDREPADPAPASLDEGDFTFTNLSPSLCQIFAVGDGLTGTGTGAVQLFYVPP